MGQPPPGQPQAGTSQPVMQQTPMQLQHQRVNLSSVIQQLMHAKQSVPVGPAAAADEMDSNELGLDVKQGNFNFVIEKCAQLGRLAARS